MADAPGLGMPVAPGNSVNHARRGQNILFADGHVEFTRQRTSSLAEGDDIYLNREGNVAAGRSSRDVVLGSGDAKP